MNSAAVVAVAVTTIVAAGVGPLTAHADWVEIPCDGPGLGDCGTVIPPLDAALKADVVSNVDRIYRGELLGATPAVTGEHFRSPTCNRHNVVYPPGVGELLSNHLTTADRDCGPKPCQVRCDWAGTPQSAAIQCKVQVDTSCARERAWARGRLVESIFAQATQIAGSLQSQHRANLSAICAVGTVGQEALTALYMGMKQEVVKQLADYPQTDFPRCGDRLGVPFESGSPRLAECYLEAALGYLEAVPHQIALCESMVEAEADWSARQPTLSQRVLRDFDAVGCIPPLPSPDPAIPNPVLNGNGTFGACLNAGYSNIIQTHWDDVRDPLPFSKRIPVTFSGDPWQSCSNAVANSGCRACTGEDTEAPPPWATLSCGAANAVPRSPLVDVELDSVKRSRALLGYAREALDNLQALLSLLPKVDASALASPDSAAVSLPAGPVPIIIPGSLSGE